MTDTDRMVVWLRETMDTAERVARAACEGGEGCWRQEDPDRMPGFIVGDHDGYHVAYDEGYPTLEQATHIVLHDPAAVLRRITADRKILDWHTTRHTVVDGDYCGDCGGPCTHKGEARCEACGENGCYTLHFLAEGYGWKDDQ